MGVAVAASDGAAQRPRGCTLPKETARALALERELQAKLFASDDAHEGMAAFEEKRPPRFSGR